MITWAELLRFEAHPDVWALVGGLGLAYAVVLRGHGEVTPRRTRLVFLAGLVVLWVASDWPIDDIGERSLLSVHMVQYLLLAMVAPGLLLAGLPPWLIDRLLAPRPLRGVARAAARPWVAWLVTNSVLLVSHWDPVIEAYLVNDLVHLLMHVGWVASGLVLWWPLLSPLEDAPRLGRPAQMGYLLVQSLLPTIPASFLTFGTEPVFAAYAALPRPPGIDAVTDQQAAGLLMKLGGGIILWAVITVIFFRWSAEESGTTRKQQAVP